MMMRKISYIAIMASFIGAGTVSITIASFELSVFRLLLLLLVFVLLILIHNDNHKISLSLNQDSRYSVFFMTAWFLYSAISICWVKDYISWFKAIFFIGLGFLITIIFIKVFTTTEHILKSFMLIAVMSTMHNLIGWYEIITGRYIFLSNSQSYYASYRLPVSTFGNTNNFATFMLFSVFIAYVCASTAKNLAWKITCLITMASSGYLLFRTDSRANLLGLLLGFLVFAYFSIKNKKGRKTMAALLALAFIFVAVKPGIINTLYSLIKQKLQFSSSVISSSESIRINLLKNGADFLFDTFGFGTGAGNVEYWMANYGIRNTYDIANIHNWWMEILVGYGLFIFILYLVFYYGLFRSAYITYKYTNDKTEAAISLGIMCCMASYTVGGMSSSSNISSEWLWVFWAIVIAFQGTRMGKPKEICQISDEG